MAAVEVRLDVPRQPLRFDGNNRRFCAVTLKRRRRALPTRITSFTKSLVRPPLFHNKLALTLLRTSSHCFVDNEHNTFARRRPRSPKSWTTSNLSDFLMRRDARPCWWHVVVVELPCRSSVWVRLSPLQHGSKLFTVGMVHHKVFVSEVVASETIRNRFSSSEAGLACFFPRAGSCT